MLPPGADKDTWSNLNNMEINLIVLGEPKAQARHKHFSRGKFSGVYDPSAEKKETFASILQRQAPVTPISVPIALELTFYMPRPKAHYGSGAKSDCLKDSAPEWHSGKPDLDNLCKFVQDSLNGVFYKDDALIYYLTATKIYSERPRTEITIKTI